MLGPHNLNGHIPCAVDVETTGLLAGYDEIIQIAVVPLDQNFEPQGKFFYLNMLPDNPERLTDEAQNKHGITIDDLSDCVSQSRGVELFDEWFHNLNLPINKRLVPIAHNWAFERGFLIHWLGLEGLNYSWHCHPRDTMVMAAMINDLYTWHGRKYPFSKLNLKSLCNKFDIQLDNAHNALADSLATARLFASFLRFLHS